jgi:biopolymer transport protein ExbB
LYFLNARVDGENVAAQLGQSLKSRNLRAAWDLVHESDAMECVVISAGLQAINHGTDACAEAMLSAKSRMKPLLEARLNILGTIGSNAPYIGLLGTVLGIIRAAHDLTGDAGANPSAVMGGVFEALIATAFGLFVAIPAVVAFNLFQRRVRKIVSQTDALAHLVLASVRQVRRPANPPIAESTI